MYVNIESNKYLHFFSGRKFYLFCKTFILIKGWDQIDLNGREAIATVLTTDKEKTDPIVAGTEVAVVNETETGPMIVDENDLLHDDAVQVENGSTETINLGGEVTRGVLLREMSEIGSDGSRLGMRAGQEGLLGRDRRRNDGRRVLL
jgi:hypothetical protein